MNICPLCETNSRAVYYLANSMVIAVCECNVWTRSETCWTLGSVMNESGSGQHRIGGELRSDDDCGMCFDEK